MPKPLVIVTRRLPDTIEQRMRQLFDVEIRDADTAFTPDELKEAVTRAHVLVPTVTDKIGPEPQARPRPTLRVVRDREAS